MQVAGHMLGASFAIAASGVPSYAAGFDNGNDVGGLVAAILAPVGGFGKFLLVLLALGVPAACAPTMYTFGKTSLGLRKKRIEIVPCRNELYGSCAILC